LLLSGQAKQHEFQAETRKLLDIVAKSLYSEKEVCTHSNYRLAAAKVFKQYIGYFK
jgi:hypothetical protein